jgi:MFS family permease
LWVLAGAQVFGGLGVGSGITVGGLIAEDVSGSTSLSGLAQTATVLGAAAAALPMARLMSARGRRPGLVAGYSVAMLGALVVVVGSSTVSFPLVLIGAMLLGSGTATNLQSRYAATDLALAAHRARALSTVVWATTVGVVLGPNLAGPGGAVARSVGLPPLSGPVLFSIVAFVVAAGLLFLGLRPDPLLEARRLHGGASGELSVAPPHASLLDTLSVIRRSRLAVLGIVTIALGHTVMVSVMVMTPVHLRHHDATLRVIGLVISVHVAGMYALSPVVGWLTDKLGRLPVVLLAQVLLVAAVAVGGTAAEHAHSTIAMALLLLGLGWSCALVAGSTLLSEAVPDEARPSVQGAADFVMGMSGAAGGALAGTVVAGPGYGALNALAGLLVLPVVLLVLRSRARRDAGRSTVVEVAAGPPLDL